MSHVLYDQDKKRWFSGDSPPRRRRVPARTRYGPAAAAISDGLRSHDPFALCQTGGFAISLDFDMRPHIGRRAIHACLVILTLSRVGNYHEQFIYRRVG